MVVRVLVLAYLLALAGLYVFQDRLLFQADTSALADPAAYPHYERVYFTTIDNETLYALRNVPQLEDAPTLLLFHGNAGRAEDRTYKGDFFVKNGFNVILFEYAGYGENPGRPSERTLYNDATSFTKQLCQTLDCAQKLVLYGESLGTAVALNTAAQSEIKVAAVILESPFTSIEDVAAVHYPYFPVNVMINNEFKAQENIEALSGTPKLVIHGDVDDVVPYWMGEQMFKVASDPKQFQTISGVGHNAVFNDAAQKAIQAFLKDYSVQ